MADKRISEFTEVTSVGSNDVFLVGSTNATNKIKASNLFSGVPGTLAIGKGGTGQTTAKNAIRALAFLGLNPIDGAENDTREKWTNLGTGFAYFNQLDQLNGQPNQWGFLINLTNGADVQQEFWTQTGGLHYHRAGNGNTTAMPSWTSDDTFNDLGFTSNIIQNAGFHNSIFRGKKLGTSLTSAQSAQITAGTFDDLFVGDYWVINGVTWRIADFDPCYRCGDNISLGHHIAVVPDGNLYSTKWNETNDTSTGYVGSAIRANIKGDNTSTSGAEAKVIAAFGASHVLSYRALYPTTYSGGKATGWAWTDARVELMNENEVYGAQVWSAEGLGYEVGMNKRQLSLFRLSPQLNNIRADWWLRSVRSATNACVVGYYGHANSAGASASAGVRPLSLIA